MEIERGATSETLGRNEGQTPGSQSDLRDALGNNMETSTGSSPYRTEKMMNTSSQKIRTDLRIDERDFGLFVETCSTLCLDCLAILGRFFLKPLQSPLQLELKNSKKNSRRAFQVPS